MVKAAKGAFYLNNFCTLAPDLQFFNTIPSLKTPIGVFK